MATKEWDSREAHIKRIKLELAKSFLKLARLMGRGFLLFIFEGLETLTSTKSDQHVTNTGAVE